MRETVVAVEPYEPSLTDFGPQLARMKATNPNALYAVSTRPDQADIIGGAREIGLTCPVHVSNWSGHFQAIAGKTSQLVNLCRVE